MSIQLKTDEMLEVLFYTGHPQAALFQRQLEQLADTMADEVAEVLQINRNGPASFEGLAFAGTCAPFEPRSRDQPCPGFLLDFDIEVEEWSDMQDDTT
ncbi:hypothetical protein MHM88_14665 [Epibacterium sp. MM17-32]|uniref:hypothetical protein n=1 Tax=Epibacterium sp. MM17-32 TaxID=2917734 RepID=UPI001EF485CA|nr:hypothetical protein [Epibacterium sp. MM17-32]MCG7629051.1 hypothetical protein [Epibacterium sp. MM17-32]